MIAIGSLLYPLYIYIYDLLICYSTKTAAFINNRLISVVSTLVYVFQVARNTLKLLYITKVHVKRKRSKYTSKINKTKVIICRDHK